MITKRVPDFVTIDLLSDKVDEQHKQLAALRAELDALKAELQARDASKRILETVRLPDGMSVEKAIVYIRDFPALQAANATLKAERDEARELAVYLAEPHALQTPRIVGLVQKWEEELNVKWYSKRPAPDTNRDAGDESGA